MNLIDQVKLDEGFRAHAYADSLGVLTIGYGRNIDQDAGGPGLSEGEASILLVNDLTAAERDMWGVFPAWASFDQVRKNALLNMRFQLGPSRFRGFKKMITAINNGRWQLAYIEALDSLWASQAPERAIRVAHELKTGVSR